MERITGSGVLSYRTRLLAEQQARSFAAALRANARFAAVSVEESDRARGAKRHFVEFAPASDAAVTAMRDRQQDARARRAEEQEFTFCADKDGGRPFFWCHSHSSGEVYEVTERACSCPDAEYRCRPQGILCKHSLALRAALARGERVLSF